MIPFMRFMTGCFSSVQMKIRVWCRYFFFLWFCIRNVATLFTMRWVLTSLFLLFLLRPRALCEVTDGVGGEPAKQNSKGFNLLFARAASRKSAQLFIFFTAVINAVMSHHLVTVNYCKNCGISARQLLPFTTHELKAEEAPPTPAYCRCIEMLAASSSQVIKEVNRQPKGWRKEGLNDL